MRILIIEDEHKLAQAIKAGLVAEAFAVDICQDGEDGLNSILAEDYDLIILDRMLPDGMDGVEICRQARQASRSMPILILTAKDQINQRVEGLDSGADYYLVKPFAFRELLACMNALLRRPHEHLGEVLQIGDLTLNTNSKQVQRAGQKVQLTTKEYALLEHLMRNHGNVLSRHNLIVHVWDFDADILPTTIDVFITNLRAKIDKPFAGGRLIHTIRGFGYKIDTIS